MLPDQTISFRPIARLIRTIPLPNPMPKDFIYARPGERVFALVKEHKLSDWGPPPPEIIFRTQRLVELSEDELWWGISFHNTGWYDAVFVQDKASWVRGDELVSRMFVPVAYAPPENNLDFFFCFPDTAHNTFHLCLATQNTFDIFARTRTKSRYRVGRLSAECEVFVYQHMASYRLTKADFGPPPGPLPERTFDV